MKWKLITCLILAFCIVLPSATMAAEDTDVTGTVPLVTSNVTASSIGYYSATISWKTNDNATSQVFYDTVYHEDIGDYADNTTEDTALVSEHSVRLTGLSAGTTYHYRVRSAIPDTEFLAISGDYTFRTSSPPPPTGGVGPPGPSVYYTDSDLFGTEGSFRISRQGIILKTIEATSEDGMLTLTIPKGTVALGKDGKRLKGLEAAVDESPPPPPEDAHIIGLTYDFGPAGATFDPPITLTWSYDPDALPEGVAEEDLVIAYYDEATGEWVELTSVVDTENNTITASIEHFSKYAIIARAAAPPPPPLPPREEEVVPPEEEEVVPPEEEEVAPPEEEEVAPPEEEEAPPEEEELPAKPVNWPLIGGIIGAVVVVAALLVYFLVIRRRVRIS